MLALSKRFFEIQVIVECGFTLKRVRDMTRTYDSTTVINFIKNRDTRFNVYILHRTNEVKILSMSADWGHIPGELNVTDSIINWEKLTLRVVPS